MSNLPLPLSAWALNVAPSPTLAVDAKAKALKAAGEMALADQEPGATVLLSPACASYDQFKDFEQRGDVFRAAVAKLQKVTA